MNLRARRIFGAKVECFEFENTIYLEEIAMDVFPWSELFDHLRLHVLNFLTITQLVAIERVNTTWQEDVHKALRRVTKLVVPDHTRLLPRNPCTIPEHQFNEGQIVHVNKTSHASLIRKLPNLIAIVVATPIGGGVYDALNKCPKLRHVDIDNSNRLNSTKMNWTNIDCTIFRLDPFKRNVVTFSDNTTLVGTEAEDWIKNRKYDSRSVTYSLEREPDSETDEE